MKIFAAILALTLTTAFAQRPLPPGVKVLRDIEYVPGGGKARTLDVYLPEKTAEPLPLVVWIHGGAWQGGSKNGNRAAMLMDAGFATASVEYRMSQEAIFPAQIEDCKAAIRFLRAHAAEYNIDPERIGVWGSSAGGHLAALLGTAGDVKEFDEGENAGVSSRVQAVCDFFGPANLLTMGAQKEKTPPTDSANSPESRLIGGAIQENKEKARAASPVTFATKDDPAFLIVHGDKDPLVPCAQSRELHEVLQKAGVDTTLHVVEGGGHGQGFDRPEIPKMVREFFLKHLAKK